MIKVGIIGTGFGAKIHLPAFENIAGVKVIGIYGRSLAKTKDIARIYNIPIVFKRWKDIIHSKQIEAVSIAVPPHLHAKVALAAIKNKKSVLCEKPLSSSVSEAGKMLKAAKKHGVIHAIDFECRYIPAFRTLKKILKKDPIGHLRSINITFSAGGRAGTDRPTDWTNYKKYGGGVLLNYASHVIDYLEWVFGPIKQVNGKLFTTKRFKNVNPKPDADDLTIVNFQLANGVPVNLFITNVVHGGQGQQLNIYGDNGTIIMHNPNVKDFCRGFKLSIITANEKIKKIRIPKQSGDNPTFDSRLAPVAALTRDFIKGIKKHRLLAPSFIEGYRTQQVISAIQKSHLKNKWIKV